MSLRPASLKNQISSSIPPCPPMKEVHLEAEPRWGFSARNALRTRLLLLFPVVCSVVLSSDTRTLINLVLVTSYYYYFLISTPIHEGENKNPSNRLLHALFSPLGRTQSGISVIAQGGL